jgi:heat shock protein HslJ
MNPGVGLKRFTLATVFLVGFALGLGCRSQVRSVPDHETGQAPTAAPRITSGPTDLTLTQLENATYHGIEVAPGPVTLKEGRWEGEPVQPGAVSRPAVHFVRDYVLRGDLDGDGEAEAVVLLGASSGGTGELLYLAVVKQKEQEVANVATALLGDRVQVRAGRIGSGHIVLDLVQAGAGDAMCCPGDLVTRTWEWSATGLKEAPATSTGRLSVATLASTEWVLRAWGWNEKAAPEPEVTFAFQEGRFAGRSGCNRYFAQVTPGEMPGDVRVGRAAGTRMACPEPAAGVESRFLAQLQGVSKFGFIAGQLALTYERGGVLGTMLFDGRAEAASAR